MDQAKKPRFSKQLTISTFRCTPCLNCIPLGGTIAVTLRFTAHAFCGQTTRLKESSVFLVQIDRIRQRNKHRSKIVNEECEITCSSMTKTDSQYNQKGTKGSLKTLFKNPHWPESQIPIWLPHSQQCLGHVRLNSNCYILALLTPPNNINPHLLLLKARDRP